VPAGQACGSGIEPAEQIEHRQKKGDADQQTLDTVEGLARPAVTFAGRDGPVHEASLRDRFGLAAVLARSLRAFNHVSTDLPGSTLLKNA